MTTSKYMEAFENNKEQEQMIVKLLETKTQQEVAEELGISQSTLCRALKKMGYRKTYTKSKSLGEEVVNNS